MHLYFVQWMTVCALMVALFGCAVTETGTPGADPSVDLDLNMVDAMQLPDDPGAPGVSVEVMIARMGKLEDVSRAVWTNLNTTEETEARLEAASIESTLSFLPEDNAFRFRAWSDDARTVVLADLRFDYRGQQWLPEPAPCLRWKQRARVAIDGGAGEHVARVEVENRCDEAVNVRYEQVQPQRLEGGTLVLEADAETLIELPVPEDARARLLWRLSPGGALLDVFAL